jgi:uncharacterized membrane protein YphA (DoxX/SURF4 family)
MDNLQDSRLSSPYWALRVTYVLVPVLAGLDKFLRLDLLTTWSQYLSSAFEKLIPISPGAFLRIAGLVEIIAGLLVASKLTRVGAYIVMAWLICIAINLVSLHMFDVAVRDLAMAVGAFALARLQEVRAGVPARVKRQERVTVPA